MKPRKIRIIIEATTDLTFKDIHSAHSFELYGLSDGESGQRLIGKIRYPDIHQIEIRPVKKENKGEA